MNFVNTILGEYFFLALVSSVEVAVLVEAGMAWQLSQALKIWCSREVQQLDFPLKSWDNDGLFLSVYQNEHVQQINVFLASSSKMSSLSRVILWVLLPNELRMINANFPTKQRLLQMTFEQIYIVPRSESKFVCYSDLPQWTGYHKQDIIREIDAIYSAAAFQIHTWRYLCVEKVETICCIWVINQHSNFTLMLALS